MPLLCETPQCQERAQNLLHPHQHLCWAQWEVAVLVLDQASWQQRAEDLRAHLSQVVCEAAVLVLDQASQQQRADDLGTCLSQVVACLHFQTWLEWHPCVLLSVGSNGVLSKLKYIYIYEHTSAALQDSPVPDTSFCCITFLHSCNWTSLDLLSNTSTLWPMLASWAHAESWDNANSANNWVSSVWKVAYLK